MADRYMPSTIVVTFAGVPDESIHSFLDSHGLSGTRTSLTLKRYAVEVPYGKEKKYHKILESSEIVDKVHGQVEGRRIYNKRRRD